MKSIIATLRIVAASMVICVGCYTAIVLGFAKVFASEKSEGSLIRNAEGQIIGSKQIAQAFTKPEYFWPRPSAVSYNGAGAGGSNKSPTSSDLTERAAELVKLYGATAEKPLPAELAAASGGGLDPHITEHSALYQAPRVAQARGVDQAKIESFIKEQAFSPGGLFTPERLVNVLELNLALDTL